MASTVAMWRKSLSQLVRMDDKAEWDRLDILSKWFILIMQQNSHDKY